MDKHYMVPLMSTYHTQEHTKFFTSPSFSITIYLLLTLPINKDLWYSSWYSD